MADPLPAADSAASTEVDVVIIGGGPAGLSAALNLGRARASVVLVDAGRPRNAATLRSHGFLTRDGVPPLELRKLARAELAAYPNVRVLDRTVVTALLESEGGDGLRFIAALQGRGAATPPAVAARSVLVATGLRETLPDIPSLRAYYGMTIFSCAACDAWELQDRPLALIGETPDLAARARLIARWTDRLTVFTNGSDAVDTVEEAELAASGIIVERRRDRRPRRRPRRGVGRAPGRRDARRDRRRLRAAAVAPGARLPQRHRARARRVRQPGHRPAPGARRSRGCMPRGMPRPPVRSSSSSPRVRARGPPPCSCTTSSGCAPPTRTWRAHCHAPRERRRFPRPTAAGASRRAIRRHRPGADARAPGSACRRTA